jgi:hypothetical protein
MGNQLRPNYRTCEGWAITSELGHELPSTARSNMDWMAIALAKSVEVGAVGYRSLGDHIGERCLLERLLDLNADYCEQFGATWLRPL